MASGAGVNRWGEYGGVPILRTSAASADSGIFAVEAIGFSKWAFQLVPDYSAGSSAFTGFSVELYGTIDPLAYRLFQAKVLGQSMTVLGTTYSGDALLHALPAASWAPIVAPSTEGGETTPGDATQFFNPLTLVGQTLYSSYPLVAVRAVATGAGQTGSLCVLGMAIP